MCVAEDCFNPVIDPKNKTGVTADGSDPNSLDHIRGMYCKGCAMGAIERLEGTVGGELLTYS